MKRFCLASLALVGALTMVGEREARANGRFPESNQLYFSKQDPNLVLLRVTFGLLVSHDRGKTFDWVCELSIGASGGEDPMYTTTPSGRWVASTFEGISSTDDQACNWKLTTGLDSDVFIDLAKNPADEKDIVAFSSAYKTKNDAGAIVFSSQLFESKDEGKSWAALGPALDTSVLGYTVDLTATDPNRIYVTAVRNPGPDQVALLLTSTDHGQSWTEQPIELTGSERSIYIAGVDPHDADKVYIRTNNTPDAPGRMILREKDPSSAGKGTFRTIFTGKAPLEAFALSPDGTKVFVGSPVDGVNVASTTDYQFTQQSSTAVKCLAVADDGLWACSNEKVGFIAGLSKDEGKTFDPLLHFCTIRGPLACPSASTTTSQCAPAWAAQRSSLGCEPDGGTPSDDGGPATVSSSSGSATPTSTKSCDCEAVGGSANFRSLGGALAAIGLFAAAGRRRLRRRR